MKTLIVYSSRDGQTFKIAKQLAETIASSAGCDVVAINEAQDLILADYNKVLIGASIRYGHFAPELERFIAAHLSELVRLTSGFYSVSLTARKQDKNSPESNVYTRKFLHLSPWKPDYCAVFAGALRYPRYRWLDKIMIRLIMKMTGGETDPNADIEYTDWQQVKAFAERFAAAPVKSE